MRRRALFPILFVAAAAAIVAIPWTRHAVVAAARDALGRAEARPGRGDATSSDSTAAVVRTAPLPVAAVVVTASPFVLTVTGTGRAEAVQRAQIASRIGERVTAVHVREGQAVRRGEVLVELDRRPFEMALREAEARLATARMDLAALALDDTTASDEKRARMAARTGVTEAEQGVERARLDFEAADVRAPFDGEVVAVDVAVGERAQPERALVTLVDRSRIRVPAEVLEASFARISPAATATVSVPALGGARFVGRVAALSPELDGARGTGIAWIDIANPTGALRPGLYCEIEIAAARFDARLAVPRAAVLERSRRLLVFVARAGRAEWAYVETGLETDDRIEITAGIAPGDTVLVDGHLTLAHGAPIRVALGAP
jgi:membrane fusion protein (multidrug efflux system)